MTDHRKLDRLLDLRRHEEQRRAVELGLARQAVTDASVALDELRLRRADLERFFSSPAAESVGQAKTVRLVIEQVDLGTQNAQTVLALAEATLSEKLKAFEEASRAREALERVLVPRVAEAEALERVAEQKREDEVAARRFHGGEQAAS